MLAAIELLGWGISQQALVIGATQGLTYAVLGVGFILVYRSTGIINFAHPEIGVFSLSLSAYLIGIHSINYWLAAAVGVVTGVVIGAVVEMIVVRRLSSRPRVVLSIATVGVAQLLMVATMSLPLVNVPGSYPSAFNRDYSFFGLFVISMPFRIGTEIFVQGSQFSAWVVMVPVILALGWVMNRTRFGLRVRAGASRPETARLVGLNVGNVSTSVWAVAGGFAALATIVAAPLSALQLSAAAPINSDPGFLIRGIVVAMLARMRSLLGVIAAGVGVGVVEAVVLRNTTRSGLFTLFLFFGVLVVAVSQHTATRGEAGLSIVPRIRPLPEHLRSHPLVGRLPRQIAVGCVVLMALLPLVVTKPSQLINLSELLLLALVAISVTVLTGWTGQLSLGQFAFFGFGAVTMASVTLGQSLPVPFAWFELSLVVPFGVGVVLAVVIGSMLAFLIGIPVLRVRGLFLAAVTLAMATTAVTFVFRQKLWTAGRATVGPVERPSIGGFEFVSPTRYYLLCLGALVVVGYGVHRLRSTGSGRAMLAARDNEDALAVASVAVARVKLKAFVFGGAIASLAGALWAPLLPSFAPKRDFGAFESIRVVAVAIVGGLGSVVGAFQGALFIFGLPILFSDVDVVELLTSGVGILLLLMYLPGGLAEIGQRVREAFVRRELERSPLPSTDAPAESLFPRGSVAVQRHGDGPVLLIEDLNVRFGGVHAVRGVSLEVLPNELVGLIGANGAGKSTVMNAVSGLVPASGRVSLNGERIDRLPVHERHRLGLGRGFQNAQLYPGLTVTETLMVALEAREHSRFVEDLLALPSSQRRDARRRREAGEIIDFLGLGRFANNFCGELSTGTRRIVELGQLLAGRAPMLLLDEPTGGVAQREAEAFGPLIRRLQRELGAAAMVIEHDMPLIMSISDRVYCLGSGSVISVGSPEEVRSDPVVIATYLGTDDRAIERSSMTR